MFLVSVLSGFRRFLTLPVSLVLVAAVYWNGLHGSFFFDDGPNILNKPGVDLDALSLAAFGDLWRAGGAGPLGRPVAQISFALNHYFSGFDPFFFKLTNLAIHLVNGVLVMLLARIALRARSEERLPAAGLPLMVMLVWLLHPVQLLAVLHVTQRMTSLSALFLLAALLCHILARRVDAADRGLPLFLTGWLVFWPLSIYSKESGVLLPLFVACWEIFIRRAQIGRVDRFGRFFLGALVLLSTAALIYGLSPAGQWLWRGYEFRVFSPGERLLTEARVIFFYLGLILLPRLEAFGLFHDAFPLSTGWLAPWSTVPAVVGVACALWLVWRCRRSLPMVSFGVAWFLVGHLLESTVLPLELVHEHRNYLPLFGVLIALAGVLIEVRRRYPAQAGGALLLCVAAVVYLGFVTALRAHQFADELRRTQLEAQHHRTSARAQNDAGRVLALYAAVDGRHSPTYALARVHYQLAAELDPNIKISLLALLHLDCAGGNSPEQGRIDELGRRLRDTPMAPGDRSMVYTLRSMLVDGTLCLGRPQADALFAAATMNPTADAGVRATFHSWYADYLWLAQRDLPAAIRALDGSLALAPGHPSNLLKRAQLHLLAGENVEALKMLQALDGSLLSMEERATRAELTNSLKAEIDKR